MLLMLRRIIQSIDDLDLENLDPKTSPTGSDLLAIADAADNYSAKNITIDDVLDLAGDVLGPGPTITDNAIARFDGTGGYTIQATTKLIITDDDKLGSSSDLDTYIDFDSGLDRITVYCGGDEVARLEENIVGEFFYLFGGTAYFAHGGVDYGIVGFTYIDGIHQMDMIDGATISADNNSAHSSLTILNEESANYRVDVVIGGTLTIGNDEGSGVLGGWGDMPEISTPGNPDANYGRFYFKDDSGTTKFYCRDSAGNETELTNYTDEKAQDAVGAIFADTASVDFTYNDAIPFISASVKPAGFGNVSWWDGSSDFTWTFNASGSSDPTIGFSDGAIAFGVNAISIGTGAAGVDPTFTLVGETNNGVLTWMEDENYLITPQLYLAANDEIFLGSVDNYLRANSSTSVILKGASSVVLLAGSYVQVNSDTLQINQDLEHTNDSDTLFRFTTDRLQLYSGGVQMFDATEGSSDYFRINPDNADLDFSVYTSNLSTLAFVVDAGLDSSFIQADLYVSNPGVDPKYMAAVGGTLRAECDTWENSSSDETDLASYTVGSNVCDANGQCIEVIAWGTGDSSAVARELKLYFAGIEIFDTGALSSTSEQDWMIRSIIMYKTSSSFSSITFLRGGGKYESGTFCKMVVDSCNWTGTQIVKVTGQSVSTGDITQHGFVVRGYRDQPLGL